MNENLKIIYREIEERYVKIAWTHKIQEIQAGLYLKRDSKHKTMMAILNGMTATSSFISVMTSLLEFIDAAWILPLATSILAVLSSIITFRYKDGVLEQQAAACKQYAAKCRNMRNNYESLLADAISGRYDLNGLCVERDKIADLENVMFSGEIAPNTSEEAVKMARKALVENNDTLTEDYEIRSIVPIHLQVL